MNVVNIFKDEYYNSVLSVLSVVTSFLNIEMNLAP